MASPVPRLDYTLVPGSADDLDSIMEVMSAAFSERFGEAWTRSQCAGILPMRGIHLTLARDDHNEIAGFSLVRNVADESELLLIAVDPARHRQGIGSQLLQDFLDQAEADGARRVHLEVRDGNPAIAMYRASGFAQVGRRRGYYKGSDGSRFDALTFALDLPAQDFE
jgi:ribosomal-protein-alanine N-acetyltransferase